MSDDERRIAPRKSYAIPVRFNVITEPCTMVGAAATTPARQNTKILTTIPLPKQGEPTPEGQRALHQTTGSALCFQ